jgi:hypothetical protein
MSQHHNSRRTLQWVGAGLGALIYTVLVAVTFRPSSVWGIAIPIVLLVGFTLAFFWLFVERPTELRKKFGTPKKERRAWSRETTPSAEWPPSTKHKY